MKLLIMSNLASGSSDLNCSTFDCSPLASQRPCAHSAACWCCVDCSTAVPTVVLRAAQAFDLLAAAANTTAEGLLALPELTDILMYHVVPIPFDNRLAFDQGSALFPYGEHSAGTVVCWLAEEWPQPQALAVGQPGCVPQQECSLHDALHGVCWLPLPWTPLLLQLDRC